MSTEKAGSFIHGYVVYDDSPINRDREIVMELFRDLSSEISLDRIYTVKLMRHEEKYKENHMTVVTHLLMYRYN